MPESPRLDELIGVREACAEHDVMPWTIKNAQRRGELTPYKLPGNRVAYHRDELAAWAAARASDNPTCMRREPEAAS